MSQQAVGGTGTVYSTVWYAEIPVSPDTSIHWCIYIYHPLETAVYTVTFLTQRYRMQHSHGPGVRQ
jgi:hypothetical protein